MNRPLLVLLCCLALAPRCATAATRYLAFGDSITEGFGDDPQREEKGYPPRLEDLLLAHGVDAVVENHGLGGETTAEGLTRIDGVLSEGGDVLLLMEGTNDIGLHVSVETIRFNLDEMASKAAEKGLSTVHATIIPRRPQANTDGNNQETGSLAGSLRELAWSTHRQLVDPFETFGREPDPFTRLYAGGGDNLHPNATGYDLLAETFADVLTGVDHVPPVTGLLEPGNDAQDVPTNAPIRIDLYDFGEGIDIGATSLTVNGEPVEASISGDERKLEIRYSPPAPWAGVVYYSLASRDRAQPPNVRDDQLVEFVAHGTTFLRGDIDRDGRVDGADLVAFGVRFGARRSDARYRSYADFNGDGSIDGEDLAILAANFGRSSF